MVSSTTDIERNNTRLVLRPNRSLSWQETKWFLGVITVVSLTIAILFGLLGMWLILPFAGLELSALAVCLYYCACRADCCEVVSIAGDTVCVEKGRRSVEKTWSFNRHWTAVHMMRSASALHPSRLFLGAHGKRVEIGGFLTERERSQVAGELNRLIGSTAW